MFMYTLLDHVTLVWLLPTQSVTFLTLLMLNGKLSFTDLLCPDKNETAVFFCTNSLLSQRVINKGDITPPPRILISGAPPTLYFNFRGDPPPRIIIPGGRGCTWVGGITL